jgi:uncharacterized repeat protein (TIGR01451 family)
VSTPCEATGQVFADSERNGTDEVDVRFGVRNGAQDAIVSLSLQVPAELAASTQCRLTQGTTRGAPFDPNNIVVGADGSLAIPGAGPNMQANDQLEFTCRAPQIENCGLVASIAVDWLDLSGATGNPFDAAPTAPVVFTASAETPVSAPCDDTTTTAKATRVRLGITAESSPRSVFRGEITTWSVTVTNYGNRVMGNAVVTDVLHEALVPPRTLPDGATWNEATRTLRIPVPELAPGETTTISFPTRVVAWSQVPNTISVRSGRQTATAHADVFGLVDYFS